MKMIISKIHAECKFINFIYMAFPSRFYSIATHSISKVGRRDFYILPVLPQSSDHHRTSLLSTPPGRTIAQVSIRWLLQRDVTTSVIIGATSLAQLDQNMAVNGWSLSADEVSCNDKKKKKKTIIDRTILFFFLESSKNNFSLSFI